LSNIGKNNYNINLNIKNFAIIRKIKLIKGEYMSYAQKLEELLTKEVIPDIDDRLDEIFETIAGEKNANDEQKEEIEELREFKDDLKDVLDDIATGEMEEDECKEMIDDILEAQQDDEEKDRECE